MKIYYLKGTTFKKIPNYFKRVQMKYFSIMITILSVLFFFISCADKNKSKNHNQKTISTIYKKDKIVEKPIKKEFNPIKVRTISYENPEWGYWKFSTFTMDNDKNGRLLVFPSVLRDADNKNEFYVDIFIDNKFIERKGNNLIDKNTERKSGKYISFIKDKIFVNDFFNGKLIIYDY